MNVAPTAPTRFADATPMPNRAGARVRALEAMSMRELEIVFQRGVTPNLDRLAGWEFRGTNTPGWAKAAGIKKFIKGMYRDGQGDVYGYNCPVVQNGLDSPWIAKPDDAAPKRFGFYKVAPVDPTARDNAYLHAVLLDYGKGGVAPVDPTSRDNAYLHAVLLDYGKGGNPRLDPSAGLRDYLVQVDAQSDDIYLGKAYYALGPLRVATSFFVLERHRPGLREVVRR